MQCNLCKNIYFFKYLRGGIVKCKRCGLIFRVDMPQYDEEIERYRELPIDYEEQKRVNFARVKLYRKYLKKILKLFRISKSNSDILMLDIGCGCGFFIEIATKEFGIKTYGLEISQSALKLAKEQLRDSTLIFDKPLRKIKFEGKFFDIVTLWDVLDHMVTPFEECKEIFRILKDNGILLIRVRNAVFHIILYNLFRKLFPFFKFIKNPMVVHLYSFKRSTIFKLLKAVGFKKVKIRNSVLTFGDPYNQASFSQRSLDLIKKMFEIISYIVFLISFGKILISPSITVIAKK